MIVLAMDIALMGHAIVVQDGQVMIAL